MLLNLYKVVLPVFQMLGSIITTNTNSTEHFSASLLKVNHSSAELGAGWTTTELSQITKVDAEEEIPKRWLITKIMGCALFAILSFTGISGNSLVIFAIFTDPAVQTKTQLSNLGVLNLAYTDLMTTTFVCLPATISILYDEYPLGAVYCKIWSILNLTGIVATMGLLAVISFDRFIAVGWSLHYPTYMTYNRLRGGITFIWVSTCTITLCWGIFECQYDFWAAICDFHWKKLGPAVPSAFYFGIFCTIYLCLIPSGVILICNVGIIQMSKEKGRVGKIQDSNKDSKKEESNKEGAKVNARILKAMIIVIVSYFILTFPSAIIRAIKVLSGSDGPAKLIPGWFTFITTFVQFSASVVNPLIYGLFRKDFREAYARILKRMIGRG